jgi:hypothetical protein
MRVEYCILPFVYCNIHSVNESTMTVFTVPIYFLM